ncbi:MAG: septal ring lytic transglycosylase RlpA family protein [bacterium]|nr:septal ring lytic transglycosylase RlpA family protein [bacterium]
MCFSNLSRMKVIGLLSTCLCALVLSGCVSSPKGYDFSKKTPAPKRATSKKYRVRGATYFPQQHYEYVEEGFASHYGKGDIFHGRKTSTAERFSMNGLTGAHRLLPLPCVVRVTNLENGRSLKIKVNDRGPFVHLTGPKRRIIDVSAKAAKLLGFYRQGIVKVRVEVHVDESVVVGKDRLGTAWNPSGYVTMSQPLIIKAQATTSLRKSKPRRRVSAPKSKPRQTSPSTNQSISTLLQVLGDVTTKKNGGNSGTITSAKQSPTPGQIPWWRADGMG